MKEIPAFKRINLLKCCDIGSRMTHFGLIRVILRKGGIYLEYLNLISKDAAPRKLVGELLCILVS
jgi:hypothetical protein